MENNQLVVQTEVNLDKNDIVAIAVAEAEKKIRQNVIACRNRVKECEEDIEKNETRFEVEGENFLAKKSNKLFKSIETKVSKIGYGINVRLKFSVSSQQDANPDYPDQFINSFRIYLMQTEKFIDRHQFAMIKKEFPITKAQAALAEKSRQLSDQKQQATEQGVEWRRKQSDIPALERQMRAEVARAEMKKSKTGQAIIKSMMDNLNNTIALIGM